jgi:plasmid maintenance system antidote protein VapI
LLARTLAFDKNRHCGTTEQFWMNLQSGCEICRVKAGHVAEIEKIEPRRESVSRLVMHLAGN